MSTLDIIIVNRNSGDLLKKCLSSIALTTQEHFLLSRVVVVDDLSNDDSITGLESIDLPLKLICNKKRSGYGASCNIGSEYCESDYLLFLNTDVTLNHNSLDVPIHFLEQNNNKQVAILGIKQFDSRGNVRRNCSRFPTIYSLFYKTIGLNRLFPSIFLSPMMLEWDHLETRQVDHVIGAVVFIRRNIFFELGGYDERFFVYYEDLDLSLRTRNLGYKSIYLASISAYHIGNATARKVWVESVFFNLRSRFIYAFKHFKLLPAIIVALNSLILDPIVKIVLSLLRFSVKDIYQYIKVLIILWINLPFVIMKRTRINWPFE